MTTRQKVRVIAVCMYSVYDTNLDHQPELLLVIPCSFLIGTFAPVFDTWRGHGKRAPAMSLALLFAVAFFGSIISDVIFALDGHADPLRRRIAGDIVRVVSYILLGVFVDDEVPKDRSKNGISAKVRELIDKVTLVHGPSRIPGSA